MGKLCSRHSRHYKRKQHTRHYSKKRHTKRRDIVSRRIGGGNSTSEAEKEAAVRYHTKKLLIQKLIQNISKKNREDLTEFEINAINKHKAWDRAKAEFNNDQVGSETFESARSNLKSAYKEFNKLKEQMLTKALLNRRILADRDLVNIMLQAEKAVAEKMDPVRANVLTEEGMDAWYKKWRAGAKNAAEKREKMWKKKKKERYRYEAEMEEEKKVRPPLSAPAPRRVLTI